MRGLPAVSYTHLDVDKRQTIAYMVIGIVLCGPFQALVPCFKKHMQDGRSIYLSESLGLILLFAYSIVMAVGSTYNPFIYFRF